MSNRQDSINDIVNSLVRVKQSIHRRSRPFIARHGLMAIHLPLLSRLCLVPDGLSIKEIAEADQVTPGAVSQMVDQLVGERLVERIEDATDRRVVRVRPTTLARSRLNRMRKLQGEVMVGLFNTLSDEELQQLATIISKLNYEETAVVQTKSRTWGRHTKAS
jgi:DNA-binding MarR family transcriptional regulator